jgi:hypothetical protein
MRQTFYGLAAMLAAATLSNPASAQIKAPEPVALCKTSQLSAINDLKESDNLDGGLGHHALTIEIQNRTSSPCLLQGIPGVTFLDKANHPFAVPVCSNCPDYLFPSQPVREILLQPKGSAYVLVGYNINNGEHGQIPCRVAVALSLRLPGQRDALRAGVVEGRDGMRSCGPVDITAFVGRLPVEGHVFEPDPAKPQK